MLVTSPTSREVLADITIGYALGTIHQHLGSIIELWGAVDGEEKCQCLLQCQGILAFTQEAVGIVVLYECHHALWVRIEIVVAEHVVDAVHAVPPVIGLLVLRTVDAVEEGEIHYGWQITVLFRKLAILLPCGSIGRLGHPSLTHGIEVRIFLAQHLHPVCHRITVGVWIGIHADAVDAHGLYPPLTVLNQILDDVRIALVQIWHRWNKPSIHGFTKIYLAGVWVEHRSQLITGLQILVIHLSSTIHGTYLLLMFRCLIFRSKPFWSIEPIL